MSHFHVTGSSLKYKNLLVVIKQTAFEEYSQLKLRGQAPKALRWKRLEQRYNVHKECVNNLLGILQQHEVNFSCVNRVELDRQHLADVDLVVAVGGDGTVLSAAHFLDHGTIPLLGINSDPNISKEDRQVKKKSDERRSHGALCKLRADNIDEGLPEVLYGHCKLQTRTRIRCIVKSTFSETRLVPALNDLLIANPSPAAVSRFRLGWLRPVPEDPLHGGNGHSDMNGGSQEPSLLQQQQQPAPVRSQPLYGTVTRFGGIPYDVEHSINVWSSGMWVCTATGSTAAMAAAGGQYMPLESPDLQYLIREHMIESHGLSSIHEAEDVRTLNNGMIQPTQKMHLRWNSQFGKIFIDGSHLTHNVELGDEILLDNQAPPLQMFMRNS